MVRSGWGPVRHEGGDNDAGGKQVGKNEFIATQVSNILESTRLNEAQKKLAILDLHQWTKKLAQGEVLGPDGKPLGVMGGPEFADALEAAYDTDRVSIETLQNPHLPENQSVIASLEAYQTSFDSSTRSNTEYRKELVKQLADNALADGVITAEQHAKALETLNSPAAGTGRADHPTAAAATVVSWDMFSSAWTVPDPDRVRNEYVASHVHALGLGLDLDQLIVRIGEIFDALKARIGSFASSFSEYGALVMETAGRSIDAMLVGVGGSVAGDVIEILNVTYDALKKGLLEGDWTDFNDAIVELGIGAVISAVLVGGAVAAAGAIGTAVAGTAAGTVAATVVAAGFAAYGLYEVVVNGAELIGKITDDLKDVIVSEGLLPASNAASDFLSDLADGILARYGVGKEPPVTIGPHDFVYVIDDEDDRFPDRIVGSEDGELFFGRNGAIIEGGAGDDEIHHNGTGEMRGDEGDDQLLASGTVGIVADGGAGDDWILSKDGSGGQFIGGNGRDWIFAKTRGATIYGDTIDNRSPDGTDLGKRENSDNIWWWPSTTLMDARPNDVLKFFGFPLTGGNQGIPMIGLLGATGGAGAFIGGAIQLALRDNPLYTDEILPFMQYMKVGDDLYVLNIFDGLASLFTNASFGEA